MEITTSEIRELGELKREFYTSSLGDRPPSIAAAKLRRLMELEGKELRSAKVSGEDLDVVIEEGV